MEVGIDSFAARPPGDGTTGPESSRDALAQLLERIEFADHIGLDIRNRGALSR